MVFCTLRPRKPKTRAVSRAVFQRARSGRSIEDEDDASNAGTVDEGVGDFFSQTKISREHVVPDKATQRENEINREKNEEPG